MDHAAPEDRILSVDIGGSHIKGTLLNQHGDSLMDYQRIPTPVPALPSRVMQSVKELSARFKDFNKVSVGFPGYVRDGTIKTAPNLGTEFWKDVDLRNLLEENLQLPVQVVNDADMLGLGIVSGKGFEMVVTLGTGFGTAFVKDGVLLPHLEIAHHPVAKEQTYDEYVGERALEVKGIEKWNDRMKKVLGILKTVFNYDQLYLGGGNAKKLNFPLEANIRTFSNREGIKGGARLWRQGHINDK